MIQNASNINLSANNSTLTNVGEYILDQFQRLQFTRIIKSVVGYDLQEDRTVIDFFGFVVPVNKSLSIKPEGQRTWNGLTVYAEPTLILDTDEVIGYDGKNYRVMSSTSWAKHGYVQYDLLEDYK